MPQIQKHHRTLTVSSEIAHPSPPRYWPRRLPSCKASSSTRRRPGRLHILRRLNKNSRKHPQSDLRGGGQYLRLPYTEFVEGDQVESEPAGGIW